MSDKEKEIIKAVAEILPEMSEAEQMYFLGQAEGMALMKKRQAEMQSGPVSNEG